jgi:uncharacterized protein (TIGR02284 family)
MENQDIFSAHRIPPTSIHGMKKEPELELLNSLIAENLGISKLFETASSHMDNEENAILLKGYATQHETFGAELGNLVISGGGQPVATPDNSNLLKRAWVTLKGALISGDGDILVEIAQNAENLLQAYGEAMPQNINDDTRSLIRKHMSATRLVYRKLLALGAAYQN